MRKIILAVLLGVLSNQAAAQRSCDIARTAAGSFVVTINGSSVSSGYTSVRVALEQRNLKVRRGDCELRSAQVSACYVAQLPNGLITVARDGRQFTPGVATVAQGNQDLNLLLQTGVCVARAQTPVAPQRQYMNENGLSQGRTDGEGYWIPTPQGSTH